MIQVGEIPKTLPVPNAPKMTQVSISDCITIAIISFVMVISLGKQFAQLKNYKISPNCEAVAIGIANIGSSLFNGMPVSGSLGRSSLQVGLSHQIITVKSFQVLGWWSVKNCIACILWCINYFDAGYGSSSSCFTKNKTCSEPFWWQTYSMLVTSILSPTITCSDQSKALLACIIIVNLRRLLCQITETDKLSFYISFWLVGQWE